MPKRVPPTSFTAGRKLTLAGTKLGAPTQTAPSTSTTGGTGLAATTQYFYKVTALNANGESVPSGEQSVTTGAGSTNSNTVNWNSVAGATGYRVYRGTAAGAENVYYQVGAVTTKVDTGAAPTGSGTPPAVDTTGDVVYNPGDTIPNATVKTLRRLNRLLSKRYIIPSSEVYPKVKSSAALRLAKPKPTSLNPKERANL